MKEDKKMKKYYICPQIEEIKLKANQTLLAGSVTEEPEDKLGVTIFGGDNNSFDENAGFE